MRPRPHVDQCLGELVDQRIDLHPHRRNRLHLTDNDVAIAPIESKLLKPLSVT
jgi:hypothetical protein